MCVVMVVFVVVMVWCSVGVELCVCVEWCGVCVWYRCYVRLCGVVKWLCCGRRFGFRRRWSDVSECVLCCECSVVLWL